MPLYSYSCEDCGTVFEIRGAMDVPRPANIACQHCGKNANRDIAADFRGRRGKIADVWPLVSDGAAISPDMISKYEKFDKAHGVVTEYQPDGRPVLRDRRHRRDYLTLHNIFDRDGGYSDAQTPNAVPVKLDDYV